MFINYKFNLEFFQYSYIREILDVRLDPIIYSSLVRTRPETIIRESIINLIWNFFNTPILGKYLMFDLIQSFIRRLSEQGQKPSSERALSLKVKRKSCMEQMTICGLPTQTTTRTNTKSHRLYRLSDLPKRTAN